MVLAMKILNVICAYKLLKTFKHILRPCWFQGFRENPILLFQFCSYILEQPKLVFLLKSTTATTKGGGGNKCLCCIIYLSHEAESVILLFRMLVATARLQSFFLNSSPLFKMQFKLMENLKMTNFGYINFATFEAIVK